MFKKTLSFILIGLLLNLACYSTARANTNSEKAAKFAAKVKTAIAKLGTGAETSVKVKLRDKKKIKGYVSEVKENSFVVVTGKIGTPIEIPYSQVKSIQGKNNLTGKQIALGVLVLAVILISFYFIARNSDKYCEDFGTC